MSSPIIDIPASFTPGYAVAYGTEGGPATLVDGTHPLPVTTMVAAAASLPLAGTLDASGFAGPFTPQLGRPIWLTLSGNWAGSVQLLRSVDGGTTRLPLTYGDGTAKPTFTSNVNAPVTEETVGTATYYLQFTRTSGTVAYRMEQ